MWDEILPAIPMHIIPFTAASLKTLPVLYDAPLPYQILDEQPSAPPAAAPPTATCVF